MSWPVTVAMGLCGVLAITTISVFMTLLPKDSAQNTKLLAVVTVFSFATAITAYALALYHFSHNPSHMIQFILAVVMIILLPASLISMSVATVTVSNMREALAAGTA
jgi:hypothetical protein